MALTHLGVYIHFPFCDVKCAYCDFYSIAERHVDQAFYTGYLAAIEADLESKLPLVEPQYRLGSIFFGGGTPSKVPPRVIGQVIDLVRKKLTSSSKVEISLEANPESLNLQKLKDYKKAGVNRVNVGIQSIDRAILKYLGRLYNLHNYDRVLDQVAEAGFTNFGADLIFGVPGQSFKVLEKDLEFVVTKKVQHISAYSLTLEPQTLLNSQVRQQKKKPLSTKRQAMHQQFIIDYLAGQSFERYEVSNFARNKKYCRHNLGYWQYRPYLGLGVAAHSFLGNQRLYNAKSLHNYVASTRAAIEKEPAQHEIDYFISCLRLKLPQSLKTARQVLSQQHYVSFLQKLTLWQKRGMASRSVHNYALTDLGLLYSDSLQEQASAHSSAQEHILDYSTDPVP